MPKMIYRVVSTGPSFPEQEIEVHASAAENKPDAVWHFRGAVRFVELTARRVGVGVTHMVLRRRDGSREAWRRVYGLKTGEGGTVQRMPDDTPFGGAGLIHPE